MTRNAFASPLLVCLVAWLIAASAQAQPAGPGWFDGPRPGLQAQAAVQILADAASHGLDPRDYGVADLQSALARARDSAAPDPSASERLEADLSAAMQRFLRDLHDGRIDPAQLHMHYTLPRRAPFDAAAALRMALASRDVALAVRAATPTLAQYERLREALAHYRELGDHPAWRQTLPPLRKLEPGQLWVGLPQLAARLRALGDLPARDPAQDRARYDAALVDAVRGFQQRHGLEGDGVVGRATWAALQVAPPARVRQLELALERLRWTPLTRAPRMIVVNIPEFVLRAYEVQGDRIVVRARMKVIVGHALDTRTPLIAEELRSIEFQPYWNVPPSIARKELVPRLRRDPGYWQREGFEFVAGAAADPVLSEAKLQAVLAGQLRIRQRPGPRNALGDIKFVFPNRDSIYLHHTPAVGLFERARRDFSHGCIRIEQPVALAAFALQGQDGGDEPQILRAMTREALPSSVKLERPVPVLVAYSTALVKEGRVHFLDDLYGHDRALDAALKARR